MTALHDTKLSFGVIVGGLAMWSSTAMAELKAPTFPKTFAGTMIDAYPVDAMRKGRSGGALVDLWTNEGGGIYKCDLVSLVGDEKLGRSTCKIVIRFRLEPAVDSAGTKTMGRHRILLTWLIPGSAQGREVAQTKQRPDLELTVDRLPTGSKRLDVVIVLEVKPDGIVQSCQPDAAAAAAYAKTACQNVSGIRFPASPAFEGAARPYITSATVRFVTN